MTNCCPRPRMRWNGAIGAIARCKKVSTVCAPKSRSRHELRLICGEKPGARGVATLFMPYMRHGQDESNPVSLLQCRYALVLLLPLQMRPTEYVHKAWVVWIEFEHGGAPYRWSVLWLV